MLSKNKKVNGGMLTDINILFLKGYYEYFF